MQVLFISNNAHLSKTWLLWNYEKITIESWLVWSLSMLTEICENVILLGQVLRYVVILKKYYVYVLHSTRNNKRKWWVQLASLAIDASACWPCSTVFFLVREVFIIKDHLHRARMEAKAKNIKQKTIKIKRNCSLSLPILLGGNRP